MRKNVWRVDGSGANALYGSVTWAPGKSLWNSTMYLGAIALAPWHFSWSALGVFLALSYSTLLLGHSVGMHRRLIHRAFECPKPVEPEFANDPWYRFMEATWPLHQVALAAVLYALGGLDWVVWGVFVRVSVSVTSHWVVTYFAHNPGPGRWIVRGSGVQAANLPGWGFLTHGECWHNNHHAFPESARLGLERGQFDPGWLVLRLLEKCRLVSDLGVPRGSGLRDDLLERGRSGRGLFQ